MHLRGLAQQLVDAVQAADKGDADANITPWKKMRQAQTRAQGAQDQEAKAARLLAEAETLVEDRRKAFDEAVRAAELAEAEAKEACAVHTASLGMVARPADEEALPPNLGDYDEAVFADVDDYDDALQVEL